MRLISALFFGALLASCIDDSPPLGAGVEFYSMDTECSGRVYVFTSIVSGQPLNYFWEFGDGDSSHLPSAIKSYKKAGTYDVTLTVSNPDRLIKSTVKVHVDRDYDLAGPTTNFDQVPTGASLTLTFANKSVGGSSYTWDFGDGTKRETDVADAVSHTYQSAGSYTVRLTSTNADGTTCLTKTVRAF